MSNMSGMGVQSWMAWDYIQRLNWIYAFTMKKGKKEKYAEDDGPW